MLFDFITPPASDALLCVARLVRAPSYRGEAFAATAFMNLKQFWQSALVIGKWTAFATSWATVAAGAKENGEPIAPINAISHIAWGEEAFEQKELSVKYSFTGLALNAAACVSWGVVMKFLCDKTQARESVAKTVACGAAVSAVAYVVDYHVVPPRLTPGFEKHLSCRALAFVYTVLALALAAGTLTESSLAQPKK